MENIFEKEYVDIEDLFNIRSYDRTPIILFRNTISRKSECDLSKYISDNHSHIILSQEIHKHNIERMQSVLLDKDPKTTIDIISVFVRLYDTDVNTESLITETIINGINEIILNEGYDKIYIETDMDFTYDWVKDINAETFLIEEYYE